MKEVSYDKCLLVDQSYLARNIIHSTRGFVLFYKGNADIIHEHPVSFGLVREDLDIKKPSIVKVKETLNQIPYQKVHLSRENVFKRDEYECVYCGRRGKSNLTIDHVIPKAKGGKDTWDNLVTACLTCNQEKADLTLEEAGLADPKPRRPHYLMLMKNINYVHEEWKPYLFL